MSQVKFQLLGYNRLVGNIRCVTGLHIGGGTEIIEIGGMDNPIIKHPINRQPYIPGSSLKGKMRSLMELKLNRVSDDGRTHTCQDRACQVCRIFGTMAGDGSTLGPGRLIVRDARIVHIEGQPESRKDLTMTEVKYENTINRVSGMANPRPLERVPAGAVFEFEMEYRVFNVITDQKPDNGEADLALFKYVLDALKLLQMDNLGGSGSRGSGKIMFENLKLIDREGKTEDITLG